MFRRLTVLLSILNITAGPALAQSCGGGLPYTLSNGTNADATQVMADLNYIVSCYATLGANTFTGAQTLPGNPTLPLQAATKQYVDGAAASQTPQVVRRQAVAAGPVDVNGQPTYWPGTATGLTLTTQNLSSTYPLVVTSANGWDASTGQPINSVLATTSNKSWTATNGVTVYAAIDAVTGSTSTLSAAPIYQPGGTPSVTSGQFTFNISEMRGYLGNGTTAVQSNLLILGEITASGGNITSAVMYGYNGRYESAWTTPLPGANAVVTFNHNLGVKPLLSRVTAENITSELGYAVGQQISGDTGLMIQNNASTENTPILATNARSATFAMGNNGTPWVLTSITGTNNLNGVTLANWKYRIVVDRGW